MGFSEFMTSYLWGARIWIWCLLLLAVLLFLGVILYVNREWLKEKFLKFRHPEKVIKIVIHYPSSMFKIYWRLIPDSDTLLIGDSKYRFTRDKLTTEQHTEKGELMEFVLNGKKYQFDKNKCITNRHSHWPEIHYADNCIFPLDFNDVKKGELGVSASEFKLLQENDLWLQLLTMKDVLQQWMIILLLLIGNLVISAFMLAKMMGWIE
jgi:hypothetical protein